MLGLWSGNFFIVERKWNRSGSLFRSQHWRSTARTTNTWRHCNFHKVRSRWSWRSIVRTTNTQRHYYLHRIRSGWGWKREARTNTQSCYALHRIRSGWGWKSMAGTTNTQWCCSLHGLGVKWVGWFPRSLSLSLLTSTLDLADSKFGVEFKWPWSWSWWWGWRNSLSWLELKSRWSRYKVK